MAEPNLTPGFRETSATGPVVAGMRSTRRSGVFAAKLYSSHRFRVDYAVGDTPAGTLMYAGIQNWWTQPESVRQAAKWVCAFPECRSKTWDTKQAALEAHGDWRPLQTREEAHCLFAISKLPPEVAKIVNIAHKGDTHCYITVDRRVDLQVGDRVIISGVMTREREEVILDDEGKQRKFERIPHSCNGVWYPFPLNANSFAIEVEGVGHFDAKASKDAQVLLHPARPILLSDEE